MENAGFPVAAGECRSCRSNNVKMDFLNGRAPPGQGNRVDRFGAAEFHGTEAAHTTQ